MKQALLVLIALLVFSCKKETIPAPPLSTSEKIVGKWKGDKVFYEEQEPGKPLYQEQEDISAYNFDFKSDGTFTMDSAGFDVENLAWAVTSDNNFVWYYDSASADVLTIRTLTNAVFELEETGTYTNTNGDLVPYKDIIRLVK